MIIVNKLFQENFDTTFMRNRKSCQNINCLFFFLFFFLIKIFIKSQVASPRLKCQQTEFSQVHLIKIEQQQHNRKATLHISFKFQPKLNISIITVKMSLKTILNIMFQIHVPLINFCGTINFGGVWFAVMLHYCNITLM